MINTLDPLLGYLVALIIVITVMLVRGDPVVAVILATIFYGSMVIGPDMVIGPTIRGIVSYSTLRLVLAVSLALYLSSILDRLGILRLITRDMEGIGRRFTALAIPALIGLIPMPGGAYVSALMTDKLYFKELNIGREEGTFLNYWFRHIWVPAWPLYQGIIITSAILGLGVFDVIAVTYPASIMGILAGIIVALPFIKDARGRGEYRLRRLILNLWPFHAIIFLGLILKLSILIVLLVVIILAQLVYRPGRVITLESLKVSLNPRIIALLVSAMIFKEYIMESNAASQIYGGLMDIGVNPYLASYMIPLLIGMATAGEFMFTAIAFPLLLNIFYPVNGVLDGTALLLAYTGGWLGVMLSPAHLCLALTLNHFRADLSASYKYIVMGVIITTLMLFSYMELLHLLI